MLRMIIRYLPLKITPPKVTRFNEYIIVNPFKTLIISQYIFAGNDKLTKTCLKGKHGLNT